MPITYRQARLKNGLNIIAEVDSAAHSSAVGFFVRTGARDEATPMMGVSHFLEHMMFKGTETIAADELNQRFDAMGARNNAYTSAEMTCFYAHVLPEYLPAATDLIGQMMRPALRTTDFTTEKKVILEEIAMYKDSPFWVLYERAIETHYGAHPLSHRVLGTSESVTALERDQMKQYFDARYSADNTVVALAGRLDFEHSVEIIERACGHWNSTAPRRNAGKPALAGGDFTLRDAKVNRGYFIGIAEGPSIEDDRKYAAAVLGQILGSPDNSRLHWALVETSLADECQAAFDARDGCGDYYVFASCDPANIEKVEATIHAQIAALVDSLSEDDTRRLIAKTATAATIAGERPEGRMQRLGRQWTYLGRYETLEHEVERMASVTLDDLRNVAREFPVHPKTTGRLLPAT
jgi:hypothetical protein